MVVLGKMKLTTPEHPFSHLPENYMFTIEVVYSFFVFFKETWQMAQFENDRKSKDRKMMTGNKHQSTHRAI